MGAQAASSPPTQTFAMENLGKYNESNSQKSLIDL